MSVRGGLLMHRARAGWRSVTGARGGDMVHELGGDKGNELGGAYIEAVDVETSVLVSEQ